MKIFKQTLIVLLLHIHFVNLAQIKVCSWNIQNFGKSKSDSSIHFISKTLKEFDLVAIVEVVAGNGGAQAIARLADELNRTGSKWDYCISHPTSGSPNKSERYAFLWKTSKLKRIGEAWLEQHYATEIEREPYCATFSDGLKEYTMVAFHAVPKNKQPETEIKYFKFLPELYPNLNLIFCGDFNCPESHSVFEPLKRMNYKPSFIKQKTTLKNECVNDQCLASEYDNIFYNSNKIEVLESGIIHFYRVFNSLKEARIISDHLPVYCTIKIK